MPFWKICIPKRSTAGGRAAACRYMSYSDGILVYGFGRLTSRCVGLTDSRARRAFHDAGELPPVSVLASELPDALTLTKLEEAALATRRVSGKLGLKLSPAKSEFNDKSPNSLPCPWPPGRRCRSSRGKIQSRPRSLDCICSEREELSPLVRSNWVISLPGAPG